MAVRIEINEDSIKAKMDSAWKSGREMLCSQILRDCNLYCKEDTGMLIMSSLIHSRLDEGLLIWNTVYAARQYYEIPTAYHDVNSQAVWRWCEVAKQNHLGEWQRQAQAITRLYK